MVSFSPCCDPQGFARLSFLYARVLTALLPVHSFLTLSIPSFFVNFFFPCTFLIFSLVAPSTELLFYLSPPRAFSDAPWSPLSPPLLFPWEFFWLFACLPVISDFFEACSTP